MSPSGRYSTPAKESCPPAAILIVDDDAAVCWALEQALTRRAYRVEVASGPDAALRSCRRTRHDLVITDVRMPGGSGLDLLEALHREHPGLPVVVTTAYGSMDVAATAVARGAADFLPKPLDLERTLAVIERALGRSPHAIEVEPGHAVEPALVGSSPIMQEVFRRIALSAAGDLPILISGPTGSGKELAARLVHRHSDRASGPFVAVNCGAISVATAERELFGDADGFQGLISSAVGGTLLLDEIGDLPPSVQAALLRVIEERQVRPLGAVASRPVNIRIVTATNRDLAKEPSFRRDLLHRLAGATIVMPALNEHLPDLPLIAGHLLARCAVRITRKLALTETAMAALGGHGWPGNVRELRQVLEEAAFVATNGVIDAEHLRICPVLLRPTAAHASYQEIRALIESHPGEVHRRWMDRVEKPLLAQALEHTQGNQFRAAQLLGIHRTTLRKRAVELALVTAKDVEDGDPGVP